MSTQAETLRSLAQARELLEAIIGEPGVPADLRSVSADALLAFPDLAAAPSALLQAELKQVQAWVRALVQAHWVMQRVPVSLGHAHALSLHATVVRRHFPQERYLSTLISENLSGWRALFSSPLQTLADALAMSRIGTHSPVGVVNRDTLSRPAQGDAVDLN